MAMTLGEKLREAREARGFTLAEVAEQTRISALYLESIENDDYRRLPGGIFNKGFVKSYAKFVGINDQEALADYQQLMSQADSAEDDLKVYRPEVLTDDRSGPSMMPTVILAVVILAAMTGGILFLVNYLRQPADEPVANTLTPPAANASSSGTPTNDTGSAGDVPEMSSLKVEFKATTRPVPLRATVDGAESNKEIAAGASQIFEPKETLVLNYSRWNAPVVEMTINGKPIALPTEPLTPADKDRIIFTVSKENLGQIWTRGTISASVPAATPVPEANTAEPPATASTPASTATRPTPAPRPSVAGNTTNSAPARTPAPRPAANTTRPATTPPRPAANN
jgi:cytoskeleton protein RodZ